MRSEGPFGSLALESERLLLRLAAPVDNAVSFGLALVGFTALALAKPVEVDDVGHGVVTVAPVEVARQRLAKCPAARSARP
ncbi:MAG TPA: hypothetical protein VK034_06420 [Enhygromyxa sp.]|nr:hypothetical protein [Enhygromyxa sp.]